jgi:hypothetical protein
MEVRNDRVKKLAIQTLVSPECDVATPTWKLPELHFNSKRQRMKNPARNNMMDQWSQKKKYN